MADRSILLAQNNRITTYGIDQLSEALFRAWQRDDDKLDYTIDYSSWLGGDTVSAVTYTAKGATAITGDAFTAAGVITFLLQGTGYVDVEITTTLGKVKELRLRVEPRTENLGNSLDDYHDAAW